MKKIFEKGIIFFFKTRKKRVFLANSHLTKTISFPFIIAVLLVTACGDASSDKQETTADSMPIVKPEVIDTTSVITPPPTGDSNVVTPKN